ncbi:hypothetical protein V2G26_008899 [Clonostachys chloroleuca]
MGYSSDSERPVKRFKSSQSFAPPPIAALHDGPQPIPAAQDLALPNGILIRSQQDAIAAVAAGPSPIDSRWPWMSPPGGFPISYAPQSNGSQEGWNIPLPPLSLAPPARHFLTLGLFIVTSSLCLFIPLLSCRDVHIPPSPSVVSPQ